MIKKLKPGKVSIVVFLTALIWVWADLSQDDQLKLYDVRIEVAKSTDPSLWVNFVVESADPNLQTSLALEEVVLKGPASSVTKVSGRKNRGALDMNLFIVPEQEGLTEAGPHRLNVLDFLRKSDALRDLGLTVESCEPQWLTIQTHKLVRRDIPVECVGIDPGLLVPNLDPSLVSAYVPAGRDLKARIPRLTPEEQSRALIAPISKTPYVELVPGQQREVPTTVKVSLAPAQNVLTETPIRPTIGFCFSTNMQGKWKVVLENDPLELTSIMIRATARATLAYREADFHLVLYILDRDAQTPEDQWPLSREFSFKFPEEFGADQIELTGPPPIAKFRLVPSETAANPEPEM